MKRLFHRILVVIIPTMALFISLSCQSEDEDSSVLPSMAEKIIKGVGQLQDSRFDGDKGSVFVFEENHASRIGQLQIAVMLHRLREQQGVKQIALEGMPQGLSPLDASWFHNSGGEDVQDLREDVAVRLLGEGEISAVEFMAMIHPDVKAWGTEDSSLYSVGYKSADFDPAGVYLLTIAQKSLNDEMIGQVNTLAAQGKKKEASELLFRNDDWVWEKYQALIDTSSVTSIERVLELATSIRNKARFLDIPFGQLSRELGHDVEKEMDDLIRFYSVASARSDTMARMVDRILNNSSEPIALNTGAAHSERIKSLLRNENTAFSLIRPLSFDSSLGNLSVERYIRKSTKSWGRVKVGTLGYILNRSTKKPPPFIQTKSAQSGISLKLASLLLGRAARSANLETEEVWSRIAGLPGLRIDREAVEQDGFDVVFHAWLVDTEDEEIDVWVRVGTLETSADARNLEEKLLQAIADLGGRGTPIDPPNNNTEPAEEEGPGDRRRGSTVVERVNLNTLMMVARSKTTITEQSRLSV